MTRTMHVSGPDGQAAVHVALHLEPGFVAIEAGAVQDVLRIANRHLGRSQFLLQTTTSAEGELVESLSGSLVRAGPVHWKKRVPDHLIIGGGPGIVAALPALLPAIARARSGGAHCLFLSDAAAQWASRAGPDDVVTAHWEDRSVLAETRPGLPLRGGLYSGNGSTTTSAGMASTVDVILNRLVAPVSPSLAAAVSRSLVMEDIRDGATLQRPLEADALAPGRAKLRDIIRRMEENIETPLQLKDLAEDAGMSVRQIERNFKAMTGRTPADYYRWLRLRKGKALLEQTSMSVLEVAVSCGFSSNCGFSRVFQREFDVLPSVLRRQAQSKPGSRARRR